MDVHRPLRSPCGANSLVPAWGDLLPHADSDLVCSRRARGGGAAEAERASGNVIRGTPWTPRAVRIRAQRCGAGAGRADRDTRGSFAGFVAGGTGWRGRVRQVLLSGPGVTPR